MIFHDISNRVIFDENRATIELLGRFLCAGFIEERDKELYAINKISVSANIMQTKK